MYHSISQTAKDLDVSVQAIYSSIRKYRLNRCLKQFKPAGYTRKVTCLDDEGYDILCEQYQYRPPVKAKTKVEVNPTEKEKEEEKDNTEMVSFLMEQIKVKDEQINALNKQINELHILIANNQQMLAERRKPLLKQYFDSFS